MSLEITEDLIARQPAEAQAVIRMLLTQVAELQAQVAEFKAQAGELRAQVATLKAELAAVRNTPRNSSLPPGSEHPHARPLPVKKKSKKNRGGQPGHERFQRALIPTAKCQTVVPCKPELCQKCGSKLRGQDPQPLRQQVWDVEIQPLVTEYQQHRLTCACCGTLNCGALPAEVEGRTGPVLAGLLVLLTSWFRVSRRKAAEFSSVVCGVPCSAGHVSALEAKATEVLQPVYDELAAALPDQSHLNIDETPFKRGPLKTWLWTFVASAFTVFVLRPTRQASVLIWALGEDFPGAIHCDRAKMYFSYDTLQWCWAHLRRDFQKLIDAPQPRLKRLGHDLLRQTKKLFAEYAKCRDGTLTHAELQVELAPVRRQVEALLLRGLGTAAQGMCRELYAHRENLWTFLEVEGVEPTNNAAERSLRHGVIWRKLSHGTNSPRGDRFVEVMLTIIETCRQQDRNVLSYVANALKTQSPASLLPQQSKSA